MILMDVVTPKATAKYELIFNKFVSASEAGF